MKGLSRLAPALAIPLVAFLGLSLNASADFSGDFGGGGTGFAGTQYIFQGPSTGNVFDTSFYGVSYTSAPGCNPYCNTTVTCSPNFDTENANVTSVSCNDAAANAIESFPAILTAKGNQKTNELAKRVLDTQQDVAKLAAKNKFKEACTEVNELIKAINKETGKSLFADQAAMLLNGPSDGHGVDVGAIAWHTDLGTAGAAIGQTCP